MQTPEHTAAAGQPAPTPPRCDCTSYCGDDPDLKTGTVPPRTLLAAATQARRRHAASLALLTELEHAHRLIPLLLAEMSTAAQARFAMASEAAGIGTEGATRHHERAAALAQAGSSLARPPRCTTCRDKGRVRMLYARTVADCPDCHPSSTTEG